jgi:hypothetical protein
MRSPLLVGLALLTLASAATAATERDATLPLTHGVTGTPPGDRRTNPQVILESADVQHLLLRISESPAPREEIETVLSGEDFSLEDMVKTGLLREEDDLFHLDFNLLRVSDQQAILEISERLGRDIAKAFLEQRAELKVLAARHRQLHVGDPELFYGVLGCFSLDWDGLEITEEMGYREGPQRTIGGKSFTPWAKEKGVEVSLKGLYWGSHNWAVGDTTFTTFGDHDALPRFGLPDLAWRVSSAFAAYKDYPEARRAAGRMLFEYVDRPLKDIARVMNVLRTEDLDARVLVLGAEDAEMLRDLRDKGREIIVQWHHSNYTQLKAELSRLTPVQRGVPFERVYTEIWHFVFAIANRTLVEEGLFADPYAEGRAYRGFLPMVWHKNLSEEP